MSAGVRKLPIEALGPDINNALVIGVIIAKSRLKIFSNRRDGDERGVWNFTLRDSPTDTINATFWGSAEGAVKSYEMFAIGDVVEVINPRISFKQPGSTEAKFRPPVSSPFYLQLQEHKSDMMLYSEEDAPKIRDLMHVPNKVPGDFLKLSDLLTYGQAMKGEFVNLLVAIRSVGEVKKTISRKDSREIIFREITVLDQSSSEFILTLWDEETVNRASLWQPRQTVLLFSDMTVDWNKYKNCATATLTSRSVITENPRTSEALALRKHASTVPLESSAVLEQASNNVNPESINTIMTTAQVLDKAYSADIPGSRFTALLYAVVTQLDLDGPDKVVTYKCSRCLQLLEDPHCLNLDCLVDARTCAANVIFQLRVNLTDHGGTLTNCTLSSPAAENILGHSVESYSRLTIDEKTNLKWKLLLTRCEAKILVLCQSPQHPRPLISLISCIPADVGIVSSKLPIY